MSLFGKTHNESLLKIKKCYLARKNINFVTYQMSKNFSYIYERFSC